MRCPAHPPGKPAIAPLQAHDAHAAGLACSRLRMGVRPLRLRDGACYRITHCIATCAGSTLEDAPCCACTICGPCGGSSQQSSSPGSPGGCTCNSCAGTDCPSPASHRICAEPHLSQSETPLSLPQQSTAKGRTCASGTRRRWPRFPSWAVRPAPATPRCTTLTGATEPRRLQRSTSAQPHLAARAAPRRNRVWLYHQRQALHCLVESREAVPPSRGARLSPLRERTPSFVRELCALTGALDARPRRHQQQALCMLASREPRSSPKPRACELFRELAQPCNKAAQALKAAPSAAEGQASRACNSPQREAPWRRRWAAAGRTFVAEELREFAGPTALPLAATALCSAATVNSCLRKTLEM